MAYGDVLVTTSGPSYGQSIVRNVGVGGGSSFENPYPDPVTFSDVVDFLQDIELRDDKTLWFDTAKTLGIVNDTASVSLLLSLPAGVAFKVQGTGGANFVNDLSVGDGLYVTNGIEMISGKIVAAVSVAGAASQNIPAGVAPTVLVDYDFWTEADGLHAVFGGVEYILDMTPA